MLRWQKLVWHCLWGCSLPRGRVCVCGWVDSCRRPTNVGCVFNEQNMEHLARIFREHAPCSDLQTLVGRPTTRWWPTWIELEATPALVTIECFKLKLLTPPWRTHWPIETRRVCDAHTQAQSQPRTVVQHSFTRYATHPEMRSESDSVRVNVSMFMSRQPQTQPRSLVNKHPI